MASVTLVDLVHPDCPDYDICLEKRVRKFLSNLEDGWQDHFFITTRHSQNSLLEMCAGLRSSAQILCNSSLCASLYSFKQAIDKKEMTDVKIITSAHGRGRFRLYQDLLFTSVYDVEYILMFDSEFCPREDPTISCSQTDDVTREVCSFLQRLPAVRGDITLLSSTLISDSFAHGFTTRTGGISYICTLSSLNLFCNPRRRDPRAVVAENLRRLGQQAGFQPHQFNLIKCNHANDVWAMGKPAPDSYDGMVTNQAGVVIAAPGADCMPLLFTDPVAKVIGAAHAGWKGTLMGIAMATVNAMVSEFGSRPENIICVIGPSVGPCCFTLKQHSAKEFHAIHPDCVRHMESPTPYVDIRLATRILLERGGLKPEHIENIRIPTIASSSLCTSCQPEFFFSHVRDGVNFGTQIGYVWIKESCDTKESKQ